MAKSVHQQMLAEVSGNEQDRIAFEREVEYLTTLSRTFKQIEEIRESRGLSKADVARAAGLHPSNYRRLLSGEVKNMQLSTLIKIVVGLGAELAVRDSS